ANTPIDSPYSKRCTLLCLIVRYRVCVASSNGRIFGAEVTIFGLGTASLWSGDAVPTATGRLCFSAFAPRESDETFISHSPTKKIPALNFQCLTAFYASKPPDFPRTRPLLWGREVLQWQRINRQPPTG